MSFGLLRRGLSFAMPLSRSEIEHAIASARDALLTYAEQATTGAEGSAEIYSGARLQADVLTTLLDEVPEALTAEIEYLLDRYDALIASLLN